MSEFDFFKNKPKEKDDLANSVVVDSPTETAYYPQDQDDDYGKLKLKLRHQESYIKAIEKDNESLRARISELEQRSFPCSGNCGATFTLTQLLSLQKKLRCPDCSKNAWQRVENE